jgi:hypothetical protein
MRMWKHEHLTRQLQRRRTKRCPFTQRTAGGPIQCIFHAGHPPHGHTLTRNLTAPPVTAARW